MTCPNTCENASHAFCTSLLRSANALFAGMCCGFFMPKNIFFSDRTKFLLISENSVLIGGLKCVGAAREIITLILNGKVMLLLKQQGRSRLNLQHASHLIFVSVYRNVAFVLFPSGTDVGCSWTGGMFLCVWLVGASFICTIEIPTIAS